MAFVKLDTGILDSTLWVQRDPREVFITALLMALPREFQEPMEAYKVNSLEKSGFIVPPGWYGFVGASGPGIVRRAGLPIEVGMEALHELSEPEPESRSSDWAGRRMVRVNGGFVILNFMKYRDKDATAAERSKRYRERQREKDVTNVTRDSHVASRDSSLAEADTEAEAHKYTAKFLAFWDAYPKKKGKGGAARAFAKTKAHEFDAVMEGVAKSIGTEDWTKDNGQYIPHPATWLNERRWEDEVESNVVPMGSGRIRL